MGIKTGFERVGGKVVETNPFCVKCEFDDDNTICFVFGFNKSGDNFYGVGFDFRIVTEGMVTRLAEYSIKALERIYFGNREAFRSHLKDCLATFMPTNPLAFLFGISEYDSKTSFKDNSSKKPIYTEDRGLVKCHCYFSDGELCFDIYHRSTQIQQMFFTTESEYAQLLVNELENLLGVFDFVDRMSKDQIKSSLCDLFKEAGVDLLDF